MCWNTAISVKIICFFANNLLRVVNVEEKYPMSKIQEVKPKTLPEYLDIIEKFQINTSETFWYRGCGRKSFKLIPTMYRHKSGMV